jgi:hypothetical protein
MPPVSKSGLWIKNIAIIGGVDGHNGEYWWGNSSLQGKHLIIHPDSNFVEPDRTTRIIKQIKQIAQLACDGHEENKLTRIVTDEFSFYPRDRPLTLEEYKIIIDGVSNELGNLPPNVTIVLSSMPVMWTDGKLRNAVLHVQSPNSRGEDPIIHHFSKESSSTSDPYYAKAENTNECYEFSADHYTDPVHSPNVVLKDTPIKCNDPHQFKSAILVEGIGIPPIVEAIDVCLDHLNGVGKRNAYQLIGGGTPPPLVLHISHIITSNHISASPDELVASEVHADWKKVKKVQNKEMRGMCSYFGSATAAYFYEDRKAEILHGALLEAALAKMNEPPPFDKRRFPPDGNTVLHEVLLQEKGNHVQENFRRSRVKRMLNEYTVQSINQVNHNGDSPLHLAIQIFDDVPILTEFLERGAKLGVKNKDGKTPISLAGELDEYGVQCVQQLLTKLINSGPTYAANRTEIFTILDDLKSFPDLWDQHALLVRSAFAFELHEPVPSPEILLKLATYLPGDSLPAYQALIVNRMKQYLFEELQDEVLKTKNQPLLNKIEAANTLDDIKLIQEEMKTLKEIMLEALKREHEQREILLDQFQERLVVVKEKFPTFEEFSRCLNANPLYQELAKNHTTYHIETLKTQLDACIQWFENKLVEDNEAASSIKPR